MEWDTTDEWGGGGGNFLDQPGTYHLLITELKDGESSKGKPIDGFTLECDVLDGTTPGQSGKKITLTFFPPNPSGAENSQRISRQLNTAFFIATNILEPRQLGQRVPIEISKADQQQFVAKLIPQQEKNDKGEWVDSKKFLKISFSDVYHVDDPDVATVPKSADGLSLIAKEHRHSSEYFAFKKKKGAAPAKAAAKAASLDVDDL